jgi:hypothetical protein
MTGAERQQRYIDRLIRDRPAARDTGAGNMEKAPTEALKNRDRETAALKARIAELEQRLALAQLASGKIPESIAEMVAMKRVSDEVAAAKRTADKAARQAKAPPVDAGETLETLADKLRQREQQLKGAQTRIRNLKAENITIRQRKTIPMSKELLRAMRSALHPDRVTDPKEQKRLTRLSQEFNSFKFVTPDDGD